MTATRDLAIGLLAAVLVAIATFAGHLYVQSQVYHPVVEIVTPEGLGITALLAETQDRSACGAANNVLLAPIKEDCPGCRVALARCERELAGPALALSTANGGPVPSYYQLVAPSVQMAFTGPPEAARRGCEQLAAALAQRGVRTAVCLAPREAPAKS